MHWYFLVLKKYKVFSGRARRSEYWYFVLFNFLISFGIGFFEGLFVGHTAFSTIYTWLVFIPGLAVAVRRLHDVGKSGWYILIPIYNLILLFTEGDKGANDYGPDPKQDNTEQQYTTGRTSEYNVNLDENMEYYLVEAGATVGPFQREIIISKIKDNSIKPTTQIYKNNQWLVARDIDEFQQYF